MTLSNGARRAAVVATVFQAVILVGCTSSTTETRRFAIPENATSVSYYIGDRRSFSVRGSEVGRGAMLVRRSYHPEDSRIMMYIIDIDPRPEVPTKQFLVEGRVNGNQVTMRELDGTFSGKGELTGEPWHWSGSTITYMTTDGSRIDAVEEATDNGGMHVVNKVYSPDGEYRVMFEETFQKIDRDEFDRQRTTVLSKTTR